MLALTITTNTVPAWVEVGPNPQVEGSTDGLVEAGRNNPVSGAINSIALDPDDPNHVFVGTVNGGVWELDDITAANRNWQPLTDDHQNLSIGTLAINPTAIPAAPFHHPIYAGLGKVSSAGFQGASGSGVLRSLDGGATWQHRGEGIPSPGFPSLSGAGVTGIAFIPGSPDELLVAAKGESIPGTGGVYYSFDQGDTFRRFLSGKDVTHIVTDYGVNTIYIGVANDGIYQMNTASLVATKLTNGLPDLSGATRIRFAVNNNVNDSSHAVYAAAIGSVDEHGESGIRLMGLFRTIDGGATWTTMPLPTSVDGPLLRTFGLHPGGQADRHFSMLADPNNPNVLYVGGDRQPTAALGEAGCTGFGARVFRGSFGEVVPWTQVVCDGADANGNALGGKTAPHADSRDMIFDANGNILQADDGGLYRLIDPADDDPDDFGSPDTVERHWEAIVGDLGVVESYAVAYDSNANQVLTANQDNGVAVQSTAGSSQFTTFNGGDGFAVAAAADAEGSVQYGVSNNLLFFKRRDFNAAGELTDTDLVFLKRRLLPIVPYSGLGRRDIKVITEGVLSNTKLATNDANRERLLIGYHDLYESNSRGNFVRRIQKQATGDVVTALAYGSANNADAVYVARGGQIFVRESKQKGFGAPVTPPGVITIRDIVIDPDDWHVAYAVDSLSVYRTLDGGQTWADISGYNSRMLGQFQGASFVSVEIVKSLGDTALLVGTDKGVLRLINPEDVTPPDPVTGLEATPPDWVEYGKGLPNLIVSDLLYNAADDVLFAATLGRGIWKIEDATGEGRVTLPAVLKIEGTSGNDQAFIQVAPGGTPLIQVFDHVPALNETPLVSIPLVSVQQIQFNGKAGSDQFTVGLAGGLPVVSIINADILFVGGEDPGDTDTDTLRVEGVAPTVTLGSPATNGNREDSWGSNSFYQGLTIASIGVENVVDVTTRSSPESDGLAAIRDGLSLLAARTSDLSGAAGAANIPILGQSLLSALQNGGFREPIPAGDPLESIGLALASLRQRAIHPGTSIFQRILEEGLGAFKINEIGQTGLDTVAALVSRLDALDTTGGNVSVDTTAGIDKPVFTVQVKKALIGGGSVDLSALGGLAELNGKVDISADVTLSFRFGADTQGFFFDAANAQPEIVVNNLSMSAISAFGRLGFVEATVTGGSLTMDSGARISVDIVDPVAATSKVRISDLLSSPASAFATVGVNGDSDSQPDLLFEANVSVNAFGLDVVDAPVDFSWSNLANVSTISVTPKSGNALAQKLFRLASNGVNAESLVNGIQSLATRLESLANSPSSTLNKNIPILNKSLKELLLDETPRAVDLTNLSGLPGEELAIASISTVENIDGQNVFEVELNLDAPSKLGVQVGDVVTYAGSVAGQSFQGTVVAVTPGTFRVGFPSAASQEPNRTLPSLQVQVRSSFVDQLKSALGGLSNPQQAGQAIPTLEDVIEEIQEMTGLDFLDQVQIDLDARTIQIPLTFNPDPLRFSRPFDLSAGVPGLAFDASGDMIVAVDPLFQVTVGLDISDGVSVADRFYIVENATPEITLDITAQIDDPAPGTPVPPACDFVCGAVGFLGVSVVETAPPVGDSNGVNDGIRLGATITVNVQEPGSQGGVGDSGGGNDRITIGDITGNLLGTLDADIAGFVDIDGLSVTGKIGNSTVGTISFSLDGESPASPGHLETLDQADVDQLIGALKAGFSASSPLFDFNNISAVTLLGLLNQVGEGMEGFVNKLDVGGDLPIVKSALSQAVKFGDIVTDVTNLFLIRDVATGEIIDSTFHTFQEFVTDLPARLGVPGLSASYNPANHRISFNISKSAAISQSVDLDFDGALASVPVSFSASADATLSGSALVALSLGVDLTPLTAGQSLLDKFFINVGGSTVSVAAAISATNIDLGASVGLLGVGVEDGTLSFSVSPALTLHDPATQSNDGRIYLTELFASPLTAVNPPTAAVTGTLHLPIVVDGVTFTTQPAIDATLSLNAGAFQLTGGPNQAFTDVVSKFTSFDLADLAQVVQGLISVLQGQNIPAFNQKLPIVNKSVNEMLTVVSSLTDTLTQINAAIDPANLTVAINSLSAALEALIVSAPTLPSGVDLSDIEGILTQLSDLANQPNLETLRTQFASLSQGFAGLIDKVRPLLSGSSQGQSALAQLDIAQVAMEKISPSVQALDNLISNALGIDDDVLELTIEDANTGSAVEPAIVVRIDLQRAFDALLPLDVSLGTNDANPSNDIGGLSFETQGEITVQAEGLLQLDFGVNIAKLFQGQPSFFILNTTGATLEAEASLENVVATVGIGGITASVGRDAAGTANDDFMNISLENTAGTGPATINVHVAGGDSFGAVYFGAGNSPSLGTLLTPISNGINGRLRGEFPIYLGSTLLQEFVIDMPNINNPAGITISAPSNGLLSAMIGGDFTLDTLIAGIDAFLAMVENAMEGETLHKLPIIGKDMDTGAAFVNNLRDKFHVVVNAIDLGNIDSTLTAALTNILGSGGINVLSGAAGCTGGVPAALTATEINNLVQVTFDSGFPKEVVMNVHLCDQLNVGASFDVDLGGFVLGVQTTGGVNVNLGYDLELGIGLSKLEGFFFQLDPVASDPEIQIHAAATLAPGSTLDASLFFLDVSASEKAGGPATGFTGDVNINLLDPAIVSANSRLALREITQTSFSQIATAEVVGAATVDLHLQAGVNSANGAALPNIGADLFVSWPFALGQGTGGGQPTVQLNNVTLDVGTYLSRALKPILQEVDGYLDPVRPVLDFLDNEVPVLSGLSEAAGEGSLTYVDLLSLLGTGGQSVARFINFADGLVDFIAAVNAAPGSIMIPFGSINITQDMRQSGVNINTTGITGAFTNSTNPTTGFQNFLSAMNSASPGSGGLMSDLNQPPSTTQGAEDSGLGISFPIFQQPSNLFKVLFGQTVDLIVWDVPKLDAGFEFHQLYPVFPIIPLFVSLDGEFSVFADLLVGFDTRGLRQTGRFFDGLYLGYPTVRDPLDPSTHDFGATASIGATLQVNLGVASAGAGGGLDGRLFADWHDRNRDGKLYFDEIVDQVQRGGGFPSGLGCLFDFSGSLTASLFVFFDSLLTGRLQKDFAEVSLFEFAGDLCPPDADMELGHIELDSPLVTLPDSPDPKDTLVVHVGPNAHLRAPGPSVDVGESVTIKQTAFSPETNSATIEVTALGAKRTFSGVQAIYVDGGDGNDVLTVQSSVTVPYLILGNGGDDTIAPEGGGGNNGGGGGGGCGGGVQFGGRALGGAGNDRFVIPSLGSNFCVDIVGEIGLDRIIAEVEHDIQFTDDLLGNLDLGSGPFIPHDGIESFDGIGGALGNIFDISGFSGHTILQGGGGVDTVIDRGNSDFGLSDSRLDRGLGRAPVRMSGIGVANIGQTTNFGNQSFTVQSWHGTANINTGSGGGRFGAKSLVVDRDQDVTLSNTSLSFGDGGVVNFSGGIPLSSARVRGGPSARSYNVSAFTAPVEVDGGGGGDTLAIAVPANVLGAANISVVNNDIVNLIDISVGGSTLFTHTFSNVGRVSVTGTLFSDTFTAGGSPVPVTFDGLAGHDMITGSSFDDILIGGLGDDTIIGLAGPDLLDGGGDNDSFQGTPEALASDTVRGGSGLDTYIEQDNIALWTLANGGLTKPGRAAVVFDQTDIENANLTATANVTATFNISGFGGGGSLVGGENSIVTDTADANWIVTNATLTRVGGGTFNLTSISDVNLGSAASTAANTVTENGFTRNLKFIGGGGVDRIVSTRDTSFTLSNTLLQPLSGGFYQFPGADIEEAQLTGGGGANTFTVADWTGVAILDGGGGTDVVPSYGASTLTTAAINITSSSNTLTRTFGATAAGSLQLKDIEQLTLNGGAQNDSLNASGLSFGVTLNGNDGNDTLTGGSGPDSLAGGNGIDRIIGNAGNDQLTGGANDDTYLFANGFGVDTITEAAAGGSDTLDFAAVTANLTFGMSTTQVSVTDGAGNTAAHTGTQIERLVGGGGSDAFNFTASGANLAGGSGTINGGPGTDTLSYQPFNALALVSVNLLTGAATGLANVAAIEDVIGGLGNDNLTGDNNANQLEGRNGNDIINGNGGNDRILDGVGADTVDGGGGDDTYVNAPTAGATDIISDVSGNDTLDLSTTATVITLDLDLLGVNQNYTGTSNLRLNNVIENYIGSAGRDTVSVNPLTVPRNLVGGNPTTAPGDAINYDGQGRPTIIGSGSFHSAGFQPVTFAQFETATTANVTNAPPMVTGVRVGLRSDQSDVYSIPVGSGALQLASLPWNSINVVEITFSEDVEVEREDLTFAAIERTDFAIDDFFYTPATKTATWTLETSFKEADKVLLVIKAEDIRDLQGDILDGEWDNPTSVADASSSVFPSGDIFPGGNFLFRFNVVPGDTNQDFRVTRDDVASMMAHQFREKSDPLYRLLSDLNDDGVVNVRDAVFVPEYIGTELPEGEPAPSPAASAPPSPRAAPLAPPAPLAIVQRTANARRVDAAFAHGGVAVLRAARAATERPSLDGIHRPMLRAARSPRAARPAASATAADLALTERLIR